MLAKKGCRASAKHRVGQTVLTKAPCRQQQECAHALEAFLCTLCFRLPAAAQTFREPSRERAEAVLQQASCCDAALQAAGRLAPER